MTLYTVPNHGNVSSQDVNQFVSVLTGMMPDQPVTISGGLAVTAPLTVTPLVSPTITSVTPTGSGSESHNYQIVSRNANGDAPAGPILAAATPSPMNATNTALIAWTALSTGGIGATTYVVLRDSKQIGTVPFVQGQTAYTFLDIGVAGTAYVASISATLQPFRFMGAISGGTPSGYSALQGDVVVDKTGGRLWICYVAGNPGKWAVQGPGTWRMHMHMASASQTTSASGYWGANLDTTDDDPNTNCDTVGHRWLCPQTGWYRVGGAIGMGIGAGNDPAIIYGCLYDQTGAGEVMRGSEYSIRGAFTSDSWVSVLSGRAFLTGGHWYMLAIYNGGPNAMTIQGNPAYCFLDLEFSSMTA